MSRNSANVSSFRLNKSDKTKLAHDTMTRNDNYVLCVEGSTDRQFFERIIDTDKMEINQAFVVESKGKEGKKGVIKFLQLNLSKKHYYGIVDRDYDYDLKEIPKEIQKKILVTDGNSLETTLLEFDSESVEIKLRSDFAKANKNYIPNFKIVDKALEFSFDIGTLRELNYNKNEELDFSKNEIKNKLFNNLNNSLNPERKIERDKSYKYNIEFDFGKFCEGLLNVSKNTTLNKTDLKTYMNNHRSFDKWKRCQGHDVVGILTALKMKHQIGPARIYDEKYMPKDIIEQLEQTNKNKNDMETLIINTVSLDKFKESEIYRKLCTISRVNDLDFLKC